MQVFQRYPYPPSLPAEVPEDLLPILSDLRHEFGTDKDHLKRVTDQFVKELERGLTEEGGDIPMNITWVTNFPTGQERGNFLTLDLGGTNVRVCEVSLSAQKGDFASTQRKYKLPDHLRSAPVVELWDFIAECMHTFIQEHHSEGLEGKLPLAFAFSYPVLQTSIKEGILQRWTKDYSCPGAEGNDVVAQLAASMDKKQVPVEVVALVNDTTGTLIATAYRDPRVVVGSIFSTGCNSAYMEVCGAIPKLKHTSLPPDSLVAINTECGAFDNSRKVLRRTRFDKDIDACSPRQGQQLYEKMVAGRYLGEIIRRVLLELHDTHGLFKDQDASELNTPHILETSFLSNVEEDNSHLREGVQRLLKERLGLDSTVPERRICRYLVEVVGTRSARLYACGIAAICKKRDIKTGVVGVDGSTFNYYTRFRLRVAQAMRDIMDWADDIQDPISFEVSEDGSGVGAALIAALTLGEASQGPDGATW